MTVDEITDQVTNGGKLATSVTIGTCPSVGVEQREVLNLDSGLTPTMDLR
jgi:hypothetical protein